MCTDGDGATGAILCTGDYTLYLDDGAGGLYSIDMTCEEGSSDSPQTVTFDDIGGGPVDYPALVLYSANWFGGGLIGSRAATTSLCASAAPSGVDPDSARAFLSYSGGDDLISLPDNHGLPSDVPVQGPGGTTIVVDWADLFDGSIPISLSAAGSATVGYWTGSNSDGTLAANNCADWTNGASLISAISISGAVGKHTATSGSAIYTGDYDCFGNSWDVLCVGGRVD